MTELHIITAADRKDHSTGIKKWARQCEIHNQLEIKRLEQKEIDKFST